MVFHCPQKVAGRRADSASDPSAQCWLLVPCSYKHFAELGTDVRMAQGLEQGLIFVLSWAASSQPLLG